MSIAAAPTPRGRNGLVAALRRRVRLIAGLAAMAVAFFAVPGAMATPTRALIAWNVGAWLFLALVAVMMARGSSDSVRAHAAEEDENQWARAGLRFPDDDAPGWGEFVDQAFVIGCASGAADVNATSKSMRLACLAHGVVAFFFNTIILALTINIGAGLI
jgi:uncharacterized membrane protein